MAHVTREEEAAFKEIMQVLESQPEDTSWQFWFRLENRKSKIERSHRCTANT